MLSLYILKLCNVGTLQSTIPRTLLFKGHILYSGGSSGGPCPQLF